MSRDRLSTHMERCRGICFYIYYRSPWPRCASVPASSGTFAATKKTKRKTKCKLRAVFRCVTLTIYFVIRKRVWKSGDSAPNLIRAVRSQKFVFLNRSLQSRTLLSKNCQHCSSFFFLWGYCFGLLVTSALGFKARVDFLACMLRSLCVTDSTLVRHLLTSWWPAWQPSLFIHVLAFKHWWGWIQGGACHWLQSM